MNNIPKILKMVKSSKVSYHLIVLQNKRASFDAIILRRWSPRLVLWYIKLIEITIRIPQRKVDKLVKRKLSTGEIRLIFVDH